MLAVPERSIRLPVDTVREEDDRSSFEREDLPSNSPGSPVHEMGSLAEQLHSPGHFVDSLLRTPTPTLRTLTPTGVGVAQDSDSHVDRGAGANNGAGADNGGEPAATSTSAGRSLCSGGEPTPPPSPRLHTPLEPGKETCESAPAPATL